MTALPGIDPLAVLEEFGGEPRFEPFLKLLAEYNRRVNLVSRETTPTGLRKLLADCLLPLSTHCPFADDINTNRIIDVGSGGGFPGIALALARDSKITLVERIQKKARFLETAIQRLRIKGAVVPEDFASALRSGKIPANLSGSYSLATLRWVTLDKKLLRDFGFLLGTGSSLLYYASLPDELEILSSVWRSEIFSYMFLDDRRAPRNITLLTKI